LAELIEGKAAKEVWARYKLLGLKNLSNEDAKAKSATMHVA
jgi:hypothetical protein